MTIDNTIRTAGLKPAEIDKLQHLRILFQLPALDNSPEAWARFAAKLVDHYNMTEIEVAASRAGNASNMARDIQVSVNCCRGWMKGSAQLPQKRAAQIARLYGVSEQLLKLGI
jgi:hypothetical protein